MRAIRAWFVGTCVVATSVLVGPRAALAGERSDAVASAAGQVMEAATTRMKAALEEARILEAAGRHDEALAALRSIPAIYEDAARTVRALVGGPDAAPARIDRRAAPVARRELPAARPSPILPRAQPRTDPVAPAVAYLLAHQGRDGFFRAGDDDGDPRELQASGGASIDEASVTGVAILALADAAGPDLAAMPRVERSIRAAAAALAGHAGAGHELSVWSAWGLATALSRLGEPTWLPAVRAAVQRRLDRAGADASLAAGAASADALVDAALWAAFLHEARPLVEAPLAQATATLLATLSAAAAAVPRAALDRPASRPAFDLLAREVDTPREGGRFRRRVEATFADASIVTMLDARALLLGTAHARAIYGFDDQAEGRAWWDTILVPAMDRQANDDGPMRGSWPALDPAVRRWGGRVAQTALLLLAWKAADAPWVEPASLAPAPPAPAVPAPAPKAPDQPGDDGDDDGEDGAGK